MKITPAMVTAARRAEYDFHQKGRTLGSDRFIATPDAAIKAMLEAALAADDPAPRKQPKSLSAKIEPPRKSSIVTVQKPRR